MAYHPYFLKSSCAQLRKAQAMEQQRQEAAAEVLAENDNSVEAERQAIAAQCRKLQLHVKEIDPDGHWCAHVGLREKT